MEMILYKDCPMEDDGEPQGDGWINIMGPSGPVCAVPEGAYPVGTLFDVTITFTPKEPNSKGRALP